MDAWTLDLIRRMYGVDDPPVAMSPDPAGYGRPAILADLPMVTAMLKAERLNREYFLTLGLTSFGRDTVGEVRP